MAMRNSGLLKLSSSQLDWSRMALDWRRNGYDPIWIRDEMSMSVYCDDRPSTSSMAEPGVTSQPGIYYPGHHKYQLPYDKEQKLRELYKRLDVNKDGKIDVKDLTLALKELSPTGSDSNRNARFFLFRAGKREDQTVDFAEFVQYLLDREKKLELVFRNMDRNDDGVIDTEEVKSYFRMLKIDITDDEAGRIVKGMDRNGSACINLEEFIIHNQFLPYSHAEDFARAWRQHIKLDIGEDSAIPNDFSQSELISGAWWRHLVAGGAAGMVSRTFTAPLDRLRVFLQVHMRKGSNLGVISGMSYLLKEGGVRSLWRGNGINVFKIAPESAIKFMAYEQVKRLIKKMHGDTNRELSVFERFAAGSTAGAISQTCIYPLEVLKTRLALRKTGELNQGWIHAAKQLYKAEGAACFFRGYVPNLIGIIPYAGIDLAIYETLKSWHQERYRSEPGIWTLLLCGAFSCSCGQVASYPLALVRTRLQAISDTSTSSHTERTLRGQFRSIWVNEGFLGLYRGITPNFMKVVPAVGISYVTYEWARKQLGATMTK